MMKAPSCVAQIPQSKMNFIPLCFSFLLIDNKLSKPQYALCQDIMEGWQGDCTKTWKQYN